MRVIIVLIVIAACLGAVIAYCERDNGQGTVGLDASEAVPDEPAAADAAAPAESSPESVAQAPDAEPDPEATSQSDAGEEGKLARIGSAFGEAFQAVVGDEGPKARQADGQSTQPAQGNLLARITARETPSRESGPGSRIMLPSALSGIGFGVPQTSVTRRFSIHWTKQQKDETMLAHNVDSGRRQSIRFHFKDDGLYKVDVVVNPGDEGHARAYFDNSGCSR